VRERERGREGDRGRENENERERHTNRKEREQEREQWREREKRQSEIHASQIHIETNRATQMLRKKLFASASEFKTHIYSLFYLECPLISISNLNLIGLL